MLRLATDLQSAVLGDRSDELPALLLSAADLARQLGVSVKTISRLNQSGKLPAPLRIGHAKRWAHQIIVEWIAAGTPSRRDWERSRR